jgi:hypothetical protein
MRRLLALLLPLLLLAGSFQALATAGPSGPAPLAEPQQVTVYVTKTGAKYHRSGCQYLRRSCIPMSLAEAKKRFDPCSVCKPPQ